MSHDDFKFEPIKGLPEELPDDEHIVWQGSPDWMAIARHVFHVRFVAAYFGVILIWRIGSGISQGVPAADLFASTIWPLGLAALMIAIIGIVAWGYGQTTVHTITNKRVVIRSGVAFQITFNIPFKAIQNAGLRIHSDGTGDIPIELDGSAHIAYLHIWPNARPWHYTNVQPMLRNVSAPEHVAKLLADALTAANASTIRVHSSVEHGQTTRPVIPPLVEAAE